MSTDAKTIPELDRKGLRDFGLLMAGVIGARTRDMRLGTNLSTAMAGKSAFSVIHPASKGSSFTIVFQASLSLS